MSQLFKFYAERHYAECRYAECRGAFWGSTIFVFKSGSLLNLLANVGLYYKIFTIVIYDRNAIRQYYKTMIVVKAN